MMGRSGSAATQTRRGLQQQRRRARLAPVALLLLLFLVVTSAVVAVVAGDERGHRGGLPMQIVGIAGVLLFGYAAIKAVQRVRAQRDE